MLHLSRQCYVKLAHPLFVNVVDIRKIASEENDSLETYVRSTSSSVSAVGLYEVLRVQSAGIFPISIRYRVRLSKDLVPKLKLWHIFWLVSVQSVGDINSHKPYVSQESLFQRSEHISIWMTSTRITQNILPRSRTEYYTY
jgi:hypothetical protein